MLLRRSCLIGLALALVGCGGAAPPAAEAPAGYPQSTPETTSLDAAEPNALEQESDDVASLQARLAESERQLLAVVAPAKAAVGGVAEQSGGAAGPSPKPTTTAPARSRPTDERQSGEVNRCDIACKALSSMRRSRDRICELTADDDERCTGATTRVDDAQVRVTRAGCGCSEP